MSADYGTASFKGYSHLDADPPFIHVTHRGDSEYALGSLGLAEILELADLAGQAWAGADGVEVRYVIEARQDKHERWAVMWSAPACDVAGQDGVRDGVDREYAEMAWAGLSAYRPSVLTYRLARRTIVTSDEILQPEEDGHGRADH